MARTFHVTVVGGGITGLSAAYYLHKTVAEEGLPVQLTLLEADNRLGGKVHTVYRDGFIIEQGPDSLLARKPAGPRLIADLGLEHETVRNQTGQSYVLFRNRLYPIPEGAVMGIPTKWTPFATTPLISPIGKLRALFGDLLLPRSPQQTDQSAGHFFRRRLGNELVDRLIEPLLSGIYAGNIDELSLMATFPQFYHQEQQYRSLMIGMKKTAPTAKKDAKPQGAFMTLKRGLQQLVNAIADRLPPDAIRLNHAVTSLVRLADGRYRMGMADGQTMDTDAVILAIPYRQAARILSCTPLGDLPPEATPTSVATVALAFNAEDIDIPYEGTGFVVPRTAPYTITACTWTHKKWPHSTPEGKVLLRSYVGRPGNATIVEEPDEVIVHRVIRDIQAITPIKGKPLFHVITRWRNGMPQYAVGHKQWVQQLYERVEEAFPGVRLAGSSYEGIGLPDCIDQGKKAAETILQRFA
ncbi:MAG: protoporphyrinogen oxidase [Bacillaceae bacterium G1]|nr:protoporphyrinogen oxidase [Bacillota bacterium]OJF17391.1 MAG: protoporphyrinogen oxidase [Bacillaceae bacterium G1]